MCVFANPATTATAMLLLLPPQIVSAATYDIFGKVTQSSGLTSPAPGVVLADYPAIGSTGVLTVRLDGADTAALPILGYSEDIGASVSIGGWSAEIFEYSGTYGNGIYIESSYSSTSLYMVGSPGIGAGDPGETLAGSLVFSFDPARTSAPATFGDLRHEIESGVARARFSFNGTINGEFVEFAFKQVPTPVPLPAAGVLLISAMGGMVLTRRSRQRQG